MELSIDNGGEPRCRPKLTLEQLIIVAWYRSFDELERAALDLFVAALQEKHESLQRFEAHAILNNVQQGHLLAA